MSLTFTILGCGNSSGVPAIGNDWGACDPAEPRNRRTRCSLAVRSETTTLIVDTGPDFREQVNRENITGTEIAAVLYTHAHGDHLHGIDDLRPVYYQKNRRKVEVYAGKSAMHEITKRFCYLFEGGNNEEFYPPMVKANIIGDKDMGREMMIGDIAFTPFEMDHGSCVALGYRFGDVSYCVDMKHLGEAALEVIKGSKIWIVDAAAYKNPDNAVHADLSAVYRYNAHIGAGAVYLTSLPTQMDYRTLAAELPEGFYPAYDGLVIRG